MRRFLEALAVWLVVSIVLWLLAQLLVSINTDVTVTIGNFLDRTNVVIGLLCGIWHYFFGPTNLGRTV